MNSKPEKRGISINRNQWVSICHNQVHSVFEELIHKTWGHEHWHPSANIYETDDLFIFEIDLPGIDADEVKILLENDRLTIEGRREAQKPEHAAVHVTECPTGRFHCCFDLPARADPEHISRQYADGVMTIRIPKKNKK